MSYANPTFSHSRPPVHPSKMSDSERLEKAIEFIVDELNYPSVAEFFTTYIQQIPRDTSASFGDRHCRTLKAFLQGRTKVKPVEIVKKIYGHRYSYPSYKSSQKEVQSLLCFHPSMPPKDINYACPSVSTWATQLVGKHVEKSMQDLTHDPPVPDSLSAQVPVHLAAAANDRSKAKGI
ncbi:hypothetical protein BT96DRAFT_1032452 [Gymnopus androsaceus JB14]|uniref:Uncharacterized protein n=1 Tax=Gymnopus androsaceus JB14 TaxID=1447944 RepID=A0A6A4GDB2_9AGAR|nr:hypothetical protein BT96DRAFT_1032452 [Gymnopus androsaceus JB14]